ncbi:MAG: hypothetical protein ACTHMO_12855 [Rhodanobacteraceae bacterium]
MTTSYRNSAGVDTDNLFDPDVVGDGLTAAGYKKSDGTLLKYAAAKYGTVGPNTGYRLSNGADIATLWAAKGTANYSLPINGQTYSGSGHAASGLVTASVVLNINNTQYEFVGAGTGSAGNTWLFSIPAGVTQYAYKIGSGAMSAWANIPSFVTFVLVDSISASSNNQGTKTNTQSLTLYFGNGGTAIYSGACTMTATADSGA